MLKISVRKVMEARGIFNPYKFMVKQGFTPTTATKIANGDVEYLRLEYIETLCSLLNCLPNDLFEWIPADKKDDKATHPLYPIRKNDNSLNLPEMLKSLPMDKLRQVEELLKNFNK
jgi:DNA-binding Xre family transcriptional regulator